jgi:hypothetical protein
VYVDNTTFTSLKDITFLNNTADNSTGTGIVTVNTLSGVRIENFNTTGNEGNDILLVDGGSKAFITTPPELLDLGDETRDRTKAVGNAGQSYLIGVDPLFKSTQEVCSSTRPLCIRCCCVCACRQYCPGSHDELAA